jgi:hypothetical protein
MGIYRVTQRGEASVSYRPITDVWILARPKVKYYGAYPNGFLERAKALLGVTMRDAVLHVCGGHAKSYPNKRVIGPQDYTLDLDPDTKPDFLQDARDPLPAFTACDKWPAILIDRPYTPEDAKFYYPGPDKWPQVNALLRNALAAVRPGGKVGVLDYSLPQPPREGVRFVACVGVIVGYNNRMRVFSVFEREHGLPRAADAVARSADDSTERPRAPKSSSEASS